MRSRTVLLAAVSAIGVLGGLFFAESRAALSLFGVETAPAGFDDAVTTGVSRAVRIDVLANDTTSADNLTIQSFTQPAHGVVTLTDDGALLYTPAADFSGTDVFTYTACGANGCYVAAVTVTVGATRQEAARIGTAGAGSLPTTIEVLANELGSIDLRDAPDNAVMTFATMAPGDAIIQPLTVSNAGPLALRYALTTSASDADGLALRDRLLLTVWGKGSGSCSSGDTGILYGPGPLSRATVGDPAQGQQAGDRLLAPGAAEVLCFRAELPLGTGNAYQGAVTSATFAFDAEQIADNP